MSYIFLTKNFSEDETDYFAVDANRIETLNVSDTYDSNGQQVSHYDAGDYCLDNSASDTTSDCMKAVAAKFGIDYENIHIVSDGEDFEIEAGDGEEYGFNEAEVNAFIKEWQAENETFEECEGFTYWDDHNWKTITTRLNNYEPSHSIVDDEKLVTELNEAIENKEYSGKGVGVEYYKYGRWTITDSAWQGTWETYSIKETQEEEYESD